MNGSSYHMRPCTCYILRSKGLFLRNWGHSVRELDLLDSIFGVFEAVFPIHYTLHAAYTDEHDNACSVSKVKAAVK